MGGCPTHSGPYTTQVGPRADRGRSRIGLTVSVVLSAAIACHAGGDSTRDTVTEGAGVIGVDHVVPATPENLSWGWFPIDKEPVITVRPGEVVEIHTLTGLGASGDLDPVTNLGEIGIAASDVPQELIAFWKTHTTRSRAGRNGHLITGPVYVEGAEPGDVMEVQILDVRPKVRWGVNFTRARSGVLSDAYPGYREGDAPLDIPPDAPDREPEDFHIIRTVTAEGRDYGVWASGVRVPLAPFMGILAVAPDLSTESYGVDEPGVRRSGPPGRFGGNLDVKHLTAGTSLFLPVSHPGARFYVGDPHFAQGDGEICGTAIEASLDVHLRLSLADDPPVTAPLLQYDGQWFTHGFGSDLDTAMRMAAAQMLDLLVARGGFTRDEAYSLASVAVDLGVTQVVDGTVGCHAAVTEALLAR